ncbi:hypothetical protein HOP50_11g62650 [Chloropicon primus]|nr:hypothetical protein A3770_11p62430 [Chloropicon primus]UPR02938.1 hypothetical protein HOP50_11g62650 [Chloropicon primus]|eukprot:QDZ23725.1 hypothetical protein A3770_11p62430 [Chloropicon primus]
MAERNEVLEQILRSIREAEASNAEPDFFDLLGIEVGTSDSQTIKNSYRERARRCHPDIAGEDGHYACVVLNEAYATLMDDELREAYEVERTVSAHTATSGGERDNLRDMSAQDTDIGDALRRVPYTGEPLSKVVPADHWACKVESEEQLSKAVFVDEITCIGCGHCATCAPPTFRNLEPSGRARAFGQWLSTEREVQEAIDMCPVDCIHWVPKEQLAPLEYVMQHVLRERLDVGLMRSGRGQHRLKDVFIKTAQFMKALNKE